MLIYFICLIVCYLFNYYIKCFKFYFHIFIVIILLLISSKYFNLIFIKHVNYIYN